MLHSQRILFICHKAHGSNLFKCRGTIPRNCSGFLRLNLHGQNLNKPVHTSCTARSIFNKYDDSSDTGSDGPDVPSVGQPMESWYYDVYKEGKMTVRSMLDVHIQPIDPIKYPQMDKLFINILYVGEPGLDSSQLYDLTKQYIVNIDLDDNNEGVDLSIKQKVSEKLHALCHIQVPIKYDVDLSCFKNGTASVAKLESNTINVRSQQGDCVFNNVKGFNVDAKSQHGNIICEKLLQGNLRLVTEGEGDITAGRLQGQTVECLSNDGNIGVKAIYADRSAFHTKEGNISLGACHGNTHITMQSGNLNVDTLDGGLTGTVKDGDSSISMSRAGNVHLETEEGNISISVPQTMHCNLNLQADTVDPGDVQLHNKQFKQEAGIDILTGDLSSDPSPGNRVIANTSSGKIKLSYYNWFASLNLHKDSA